MTINWDSPITMWFYFYYFITNRAVIDQHRFQKFILHNYFDLWSDNKEEVTVQVVLPSVKTWQVFLFILVIFPITLFPFLVLKDTSSPKRNLELAAITLLSASYLMCSRKSLKSESDRFLNSESFTKISIMIDFWFDIIKL